MVLLHRKLNFTKDPVQRGGGNIFQGRESNFFRGDPNANFNKNPYNLVIFQGGPDPLYSPLWIRT